MFLGGTESGIELLAIWIGNKYGVFEKNAIRLSHEFNIQLSEDNGQFKAVLTPNENFLRGFYGNTISSISAIVGENGVGKTTLLRYIKEMFIKNNPESSERLYDIILFKEHNEIILYCHSDIKDNVQFEAPSNYETRIRYYLNYPKLDNLFKNLNVIYYSNNLDMNQREQESTMYYNISTSYLIENIGRINSRLRNKRIRNQNGIGRFQYTEMQRQINFVNTLNELEKDPEIPFKGIESLEMRIKYLPPSEYQKLLRDAQIYIKSEKSDEDLKLKWDEVESILKHHFERIIDQHSENRTKNQEPKNDFLENIRFSVMQNIICSKDILSMCVGDHDFLDEVLHRFLEDIVKKSHIEERRLLIDSLKILHRFLQEKHKYEGNSEGYLEKYSSARKLRRIINEIDNLINFINYFFGILESFSYEDHTFKISTSSLNVGHVLSEYYGSDFNYKFLSFHWPRLSSGQESLIAFYSRLYELSQNSKAENLILLIDEGDLYFHPQWQKNYLYYLFEFYKLPFIDYKKIQMIITSHSSFMLSDLLSDNILFLEKENGNVSIKNGKEKEIRTFGGNIHDLLAHSFFIKGPLIGKFSEQKIQDLILDIKETNTDRQGLLEHLGDSFLKAAIQNMLDTKTND